MTTCRRGDIVLVTFVFADENGVKKRPGLVVSSDSYQRGRREVVLAAVTSNVARLLVGDYRIEAWRECGLVSPSIVTGIVRTIKQDMIVRKMGSLPASELKAVEDELRVTLGLAEAAVATDVVTEASR